ncbi:cytochrome b/b6 domain-containing protein [Ideonella sp.]|uniref:cytochrome b/b6 domain-containing protein n=1 Tax=Ideonella sp. TaxID=1929293 RepID=UPI0035AEE74B
MPADVPPPVLPIPPGAPEPVSPPLQPVRIWDLPTRLFHALLAMAVVALVVTGNVGGDALAWHMGLGCAVGALLAFRLVWGLVGGRWSRFSHILWAPTATWRYLRGRPAAGERFDIGHSPLGSLSVLAMLLALAAQVATGLVADDEIFTTGPLYRFVSGATSSLATSWHTGWGKAVVIALVVLHLGAIAWYRLGRRQNLVGPMLHGDKPLPPGTPASQDGVAQRGLALVLAAACAAGAWAVWRLG